jgi:hypothetical protein
VEGDGTLKPLLKRRASLFGHSNAGLIVWLDQQFHAFQIQLLEAPLKRLNSRLSTNPAT